MKPDQPTSLDKAIKLDYQNNDSIWLSEQNSLRKLVGFLGMALPVLLVGFLLIDTGYQSPLQSISHYYYTRACSIFVITISLLAIFLIIYKGKERIDFYISSTAGIFALLLVLFPASNIKNLCCDTTKPYAVTILKISDFRNGFHLVSAAIFLTCLAFMSIFLFTRSNKAPDERTSRKKLRNKLYRISGVIMIIALLIIFFNALNIHIFSDAFYNVHHLTFWMETLAVESFGISWAIKGGTILKD